MKTLVTIFSIIIPSLISNGKVNQSTIINQKTMNLIITSENHKATAILYDNPTGRDFASMLPLELTLNDYASIEKVATLSRKLSIQDATSGFDPSIGDLTYYAPWGNIALFYKDFDYANGLVSMGKITSDMEFLKSKEPIPIKIELQP